MFLFWPSRLCRALLQLLVVRNWPRGKLWSSRHRALCRLHLLLHLLLHLHLHLLPHQRPPRLLL